MTAIEMARTPNSSPSQEQLRRLMGHAKGLTRDSEPLVVRSLNDQVHATVRINHISRLSSSNPLIAGFLWSSEHKIAGLPRSVITVYSPFTEREGKKSVDQYSFFKRKEDTEHKWPTIHRDVSRIEKAEWGEFPQTEAELEEYVKASKDWELKKFFHSFHTLYDRQKNKGEGNGTLFIPPYSHDAESVSATDILSLEKEIERASGHNILD